MLVPFLYSAQGRDCAAASSATLSRVGVYGNLAAGMLQAEPGRKVGQASGALDRRYEPRE